MGEEMAQVMKTATRIKLYSANRYPRSNDEAAAMGLGGKRNEEMRAMTIAAFRVAQNNDQLSQVMMDAEVLGFLLADSRSAINYWIENNRLSRSGTGYRLEPAGVVECQNTLLGRSGAYSTTEAKVREWTKRMINGDRVATRSREFDEALWGKVA